MTTIEILAHTTASRLPITEHVRVPLRTHADLAAAIRDAQQRARALADSCSAVRWVQVQVRRPPRPPTPRRPQAQPSQRVIDTACKREICRLMAQADGLDVTRREIQRLRDWLDATLPPLESDP